MAFTKKTGSFGGKSNKLALGARAAKQPNFNGASAAKPKKFSKLTSVATDRGTFRMKANRKGE